MAGAHTPWHIACLAVNLPPKARTIIAEDRDFAWGLEEVLLAMLFNSLNALIWGMGDKHKRGPQPEPIGPERLIARNKRSLPARSMPVDELMEQLKKPRR